MKKRNPVVRDLIERPKRNAGRHVERKRGRRSSLEDELKLIETKRKDKHDL